MRLNMKVSRSLQSTFESTPYHREYIKNRYIYGIYDVGIIGEVAMYHTLQETYLQFPVVHSPPRVDEH